MRQFHWHQKSKELAGFPGDQRGKSASIHQSEPKRSLVFAAESLPTRSRCGSLNATAIDWKS